MNDPSDPRRSVEHADGPSSAGRDPRSPSGARAEITTWARNPGGEWHWVRFTLTDTSLRIRGSADSGRYVVDLVDITRVDEVGDPPSHTIEVETVRGEVFSAAWDAAFTDSVITALRATVAGSAATHPLPGTSAAVAPRRLTTGVRRLVTAAALTALVLGVLLVDLGVVFLRISTVEAEFPEADHHATTWVLVGSDARDAAAAMPNTDAFGTSEEVPGERADVVILVQEGTEQQPATIVSVPRDLLVFRRDKGVDRLALTYLDGPTSLVTSICRSLGVAVDHLVVIDFEGIRRLVDQVDGIHVNAQNQVRDRHSGLELEAGVNHLDGAAAVAWVRSRHSEHLVNDTWVPDLSADKGRQERQRLLLGELATRFEQHARNPVRARQAAWTVTSVLRTGPNTLPPDLLRLALTLRSSPPASSLPHATTGGPIPVAHLIPEAEPMLDRLRNHQPDGPPCPRPRLS